jgi:(2Fe-2S) ferredoxin
MLPCLMRDAPLAPRVHLFVCVNRRDGASPLGPGCGSAGDAVYDEMKRAVARRGSYQETWVTRTLCLGVCPKRGCTVAIHPAGRIVAEVDAADAASLFEEAVS